MFMVTIVMRKHSVKYREREGDRKIDRAWPT